MCSAGLDSTDSPHQSAGVGAPSPRASRRRREEGFSLIEVLFAMAVLMTAALGLAQMFALSIHRNAGARHQTSTTVLAMQKMEQLRALTCGFDPASPDTPISDLTSDLATDPPGSTGHGLNPSPVESLDVNTSGYVDFLDKRGQWVGTGATPPPSAQYIRRWSIQPLPTNPNNTLLLQVLVTPIHRERHRGPGPRTRHADDSVLTTVRTRKSS
jgi:type II secretory pathway pseudopilin PulG